MSLLKRKRCETEDEELFQNARPLKPPMVNVNPDESMDMLMPNWVDMKPNVALKIELPVFESDHHFYIFPRIFLASMGNNIDGKFTQVRFDFLNALYRNQINLKKKCIRPASDIEEISDEDLMHFIAVIFFGLKNDDIILDTVAKGRYLQAMTKKYGTVGPSGDRYGNDSIFFDEPNIVPHNEICHFDRPGTWSQTNWGGVFFCIDCNSIGSIGSTHTMMVAFWNRRVSVDVKQCFLGMQDINICITKTIIQSQ